MENYSYQSGYEDGLEDISYSTKYGKKAIDFYWDGYDYGYINIEIHEGKWDHSLIVKCDTCKTKNGFNPPPKKCACGGYWTPTYTRGYKRIPAGFGFSRKLTLDEIDFYLKLIELEERRDERMYKKQFNEMVESTGGGYY